jgi:hypothetical protein
MARSIRRRLVARLLPAVAVACLLAGADGADASVVLDYTTVGDFTQPFSYNNCGVSVRAFADATLTTSADMNVNAASGGPGIAVDGHDALSFDGGEALQFLFFDAVADELVGATAISYVVSEAPGTTDGDAVPAELSIEAFGPGGGSLGVEELSGVGERSISAAFGGEAIESFVMSAIDPVRIEGIAYEPPPGMALTVQWSFGGSYEREQVELCGVSLDGSNTLTVGGLANGDGVGVKGGFAGSQPDTLIDSGETLEVGFAEPATEVAYHQSSNLFVTLVGGVVFDLEAFDAGNVSLGTEHLLTDSPDIDLSALFGGEALSRFVIGASPEGQDGQQLGSVTFVIPEAGGVASGIAGLASAVAIARRRLRSASPTR